MCGAIWHYLHVANRIDSQTYRAPHLVMALASFTVVAVGSAILVWLGTLGRLPRESDFHRQ